MLVGMVHDLTALKGTNRLEDDIYLRSIDIHLGTATDIDGYSQKPG